LSSSGTTGNLSKSSSRELPKNRNLAETIKYTNKYELAIVVFGNNQAKND
jgi:hypothetical protein